MRLNKERGEEIQSKGYGNCIPCEATIQVRTMIALSQVKHRIQFVTLSMVLSVLPLLVQAQFMVQSAVPTDARDFTIDELGNLYFIHDPYIERIHAVGGHTVRTSDLNYGNIDYVDVTNPLKPFVHYRGTGKVIVFDNTLSRMGTSIDLFEKGWEQVELVAGSRGDAYWFWDVRNSEMIRVDNTLRKLSSTGNLGTLLNKSLHPVQIIERGSFVYLRDEVYGLFVFDIYGTYKTNLAIRADGDIQVVNDEIIYITGNELVVMDKTWLTETRYTLPSVAASKTFFYGKKLYTLSDNKLQTWVWEEK